MAAARIDYVEDPRSNPQNVPAPLIHEPFEPSSVRQGEPFFIVAKSDTAACRFPVWRISPAAIEFEAQADSDLDSSSKAFFLQIGMQDIPLRFSRLHGPWYEEGRRIMALQIGAKESTTDGEMTNGGRVLERWLCDPRFNPVGMAANPAKLGDTVHFRVLDISKEGLRILTSMRNKRLVPGMVLKASVHLPTGGDVRMTVRLVRAEVFEDTHGKHIGFGAKILQCDETFSKKTGQYLLNFGSPEESTKSLRTLRDAGFTAPSISATLTFDFVADEADRLQVLGLRRDAYVRAGKISVGATPESMADEFDTRARIIAAKHDGRVVASARLIFSDGVQPLEHEQDVVLPASFPSRKAILEVSRLCVHHDYKGNDLMFNLLKQSMLVALQTHRKYIMGSSTRSLVHVYQNVGCVFPGLSYNSAAFGGLEHHIFLCDVGEILTGGRINPVIWSLFAPDVLAQLPSRYPPNATRAARWRQDIYQHALPVSRFIADVAGLHARRLAHAKKR